ncbi:MAG: hypothetical protein LUC43_00250 [Burkholderiales bacterium]|nr:hypothetical protein [Burkholderiales bacterium]
MPDEELFPIKTRIVKVTNKRTGVRYLEERTYQYDPKLKYNRTLSSRRVGQKIEKGSNTPVPCRPKSNAQKAAQNTTTKAPTIAVEPV